MGAASEAAGGYAARPEPQETTGRPRQLWHFLSKLLAFAVTNIGLVLLAASSHSRLTSKTTGGVRNVNYAAEMMVWTGLSINALNSGAVETKTQLCFVLAPVSFLVPCISF